MNEPERTLGRRSVLKMAGGAATASVASLVYGADQVRADRGKSSGDEYETWTIRGKEVYDLSDGEVLENVLVDQTAAGASLTIRSRNKSDWEVRNVGFLGVGQAGDGSNRFQFQVSVPAGSNGVIENVWANGKARDGQSGSQLGGIYIRSSHGGHIDVKHTYIEGYGNNAVYGSAVGKDGGKDGSVRIENSYHRDNTSSQFRIGSPNSVVRNCVGVIDDPEGKRGPYPGTSSNRNARGIWGKHFRDQRIENSVFYVSPDDTQPDGAFEGRYITNRSHGDKAVVEAQDCHVNADAPNVTGTTSNAEVNFTNLGESPTVSVIEDGGVPTSPKMAARGEREMPPELPGASEDTSDDTSDITGLGYENDAVAAHKSHYDTDDTASVEFSMKNTVDQALTVTHVTVSPHDASINEFQDESKDVGPWGSEVHIDADTQVGFCDVAGSAGLPSTIDMANDGWQDAADEVAIMSPGSKASIALGRFEHDGTPIDMTGENVDIEIGYELDDGTRSTDGFTIEPDGADSGPTDDSSPVTETETNVGDTERNADREGTQTDGGDERDPGGAPTETDNGDAKPDADTPGTRTDGNLDFVSRLLNLLGRILRGY